MSEKSNTTGLFTKEIEDFKFVLDTKDPVHTIWKSFIYRMKSCL